MDYFFLTCRRTVKWPRDDGGEKQEGRKGINEVARGGTQCDVESIRNKQTLISNKQKGSYRPKKSVSKPVVPLSALDC